MNGKIAISHFMKHWYLVVIPQDYFQIRQSLYEKSTRYRNLWLKENVTNFETLQVNQNEHVALMVLALERDTKAGQKLIEAHIMTPVEIIKKSLS